MAIVPTPKNDQITGTPAGDIIDALAGNDVVRAGDGADDVRGNRGNDELFGEAGADRLSGDQGNDVVWAGDGDDVVFGSRGNDELFGDEGDDRLSGDQGNDDIDGGDGLDTAVYGGSLENYEVTTDANGVTTVQALRGPDGVDQVTNTEFFEFEDGTFQLENGVLVPVNSDTDGFIGSIATLNILSAGTFSVSDTVGDGLEFSADLSTPLYDISKDQIYVDFERNFTAGNEGVRFDFSDEGAPDIESVSLEDNIEGLDATDITLVDANTILVDYSGMVTTPDSYYRITVDFV